MLDSAHAEYTLPLLKNELPDPSQELFHSDFPLFSSLPVELRLKIWRHTFPPTRCIVTFAEKDVKNVCFPGPLTIAWVNQESRAETLKHYQLMEKRSSLYQTHQYNVKVRGTANFFLSRNGKENIIQVQDCGTRSPQDHGDFLDEYLGSDDWSWPFFSGIGTLELKMRSWCLWSFNPHDWIRVLCRLSLIRLIDMTYSDSRDNFWLLKFREDAAQLCVSAVERSYTWLRFRHLYTIPEVVLYGSPGSNHAKFVQWHQEYLWEQGDKAADKGDEAINEGDEAADEGSLTEIEDGEYKSEEVEQVEQRDCV